MGSCQKNVGRETLIASQFSDRSTTREAMMFTATTTIHPTVYVEHTSTESFSHGHSIPLLSHLDTSNTGVLGVSCLSSYLTSLGVYDNDSVVEYLGLGDDEIVDLETANKRLWEEIDQALHIVRYP